MRIASLLPSATEIVHALGLGDRLVAVSHECDFPPSVKELPVVTRALIPAGAASAEIDRMVRERAAEKQPLYAMDLEALEALEPDLILTQSLCNVCAVSEEEVNAAACALPVRPEILDLEARTFADVLEGIRRVAVVSGVEEFGEDLVRRLRSRAIRVAARSASLVRATRVAFLEWLDPPFGSGHWNPELIAMAGGRDPFGRAGAAAKTLEWRRVEAYRPEVVFIACCGYDVERAREDLPALSAMTHWRSLPATHTGRVFVTDGSQYFSRPGPRLVDSLEMLAHAIHPEFHPPPAHAAPALQVDLAAVIGGRRLDPSGTR